MALEAQNNPFTSVLMVEAADPEAIGDADPAAGQRRLVVGTDHLLYLLDDSGVKHAVGGASGAVATDAIWDAAGDLAVGSGANTAAKLTKGSDGTVLTVTAGAVGWAAPASSGALVLLEQHTASTSATLNFTTCISSTYDEYMIEILDLKPATNSVGFGMRVGTGGGPTYDTGNNYAYSAFRYTSGAASGTGGNAALSSFPLDGGDPTIVNTSGLSGTIKFYAPAAGVARRRLTGQSAYTTGGSGEIGAVFSFHYIPTTAITAFQFLASSGNITSGTIRVYGVAK